MANLLPIAPAKITWGMLWKSMRKSPGRVALIAALFVLNSVLALVTPWQIGHLIDDAIANNLHSFPWTPLALIFGAVVLSTVSARWWVYQSEIVGTRINQDLGIDLIESSLNLDAQTIEDAGGGDLVSRITDDLDSVRRVITQAIPELVAVTVSILVICASVFVLSPMLGLITVPMIIAQVFSFSYFLPRIAAIVTVRAEKVSSLTTTVTENVRGARTSAELGIVNARQNTMNQKIHEQYEVQDGLIRLRSNFWAVDSFIAYTPLMLSLIWGSYCVHRGWATWGMVSTAAVLVFTMRVNADIFGYWLSIVREMTVTMGRISGVIDLAEQHRQQRNLKKVRAGESGQSKKTPCDQIPAAVKIENLEFGYRPESPVMHQINLEIPRGQSVAFIGRSGSGKTTLARLISGSLTATDGSVSVMGQRVGLGDFPTAPDASGRPQLLICTQEAHLFLGTLAENMSVANPQATQEQMKQALDEVGATWWRDLEQSLNTVVGIGNAELSRDQIQQLSLARIVVANPHIVILDESTTQLELADAQDSIRGILAGRTVIIISHDSRIASLADRFVYLDDGRIVRDEKKVQPTGEAQ